LELISISKRKKLNMADGKIGVGGTIGIVVGVTAVLGLGLYFILRKKTSNVAPAYVPPPTSSAELEALKTQLAILQQQNANAKANSLSQQQKDANEAQIQGIAIALGGKLATSLLEKWTSKWGSNQTSVYGNTGLATGVPDGYMLDNPYGSVGQYDYLNPWSKTVLVNG
jgi:hypothetical protein